MTENQQIICPSCNLSIPTHSSQCPICGEQLQRCPVCGKIYGSKAKFCTKDGTKLIYTEKTPVQKQDFGQQNNNSQTQNVGQQPTYGVGNQFSNNNHQNNNQSKKKKMPAVGIIIAACVIAVLCIGGIFAFHIFNENDTTDIANGLLQTETSKEIDKSKDYEDDGAYVLWSDQKNVGKLCTVKIYTPGGYLMIWADNTRKVLSLHSAGYKTHGSFEIASIKNIQSNIEDEKADAEELGDTITDEQTCETNAGTVHYIARAVESDDFVTMKCWLKFDKNTALFLDFSLSGNTENLKDTEKMEQIIGEIFDCVGQKPDDSQKYKSATKLVEDEELPERDEDGAYVLQPSDSQLDDYYISNVRINPIDHCLLYWLGDDHDNLQIETDDISFGYYTLDTIDYLDMQEEHFDYNNDCIKTDLLSCETEAGTVSYIATIDSDNNILDIHSWLQYDDSTLLIFDGNIFYDDITEANLNDTEKMEKSIQQAYSGVIKE